MGSRKLAGVLIETRFQRDGGGWAVIGVGLNLTVATGDLPEDLRETATSLAIEVDGATPTPAEAKAALDASLGRWVDADDAAVLDGFRSRDALAGRRISWDGGSGTAAGIDDAGHLLVDQDCGWRGRRAARSGAGEVHLSVER